MAEEFQLGRGNWWESSSSSSTRNKFHSGILSSSTTNTTTTPSPSNNFDWPTEIVDIKDRSSLNPGSSVSDGSMVFQADSHKLGRHVLPDPNLQLVGLGLSSQGLDWNQSFLGEKSGSDYSYEQEATTACHEQDHQWTQKTYNVNSDESSVVNEYKQQMNRGMSLEHHQQPVVFNNLESSNYASPSTMLQGLLLSDHQTQQEAANFTNAASLYYNDPTNNPMPASSTSSSWSKFPQFLRTSPPKHQWSAHGQSSHNFTNTTPFWNASMDDVRSGFIPSLQPHIPNTSIDEKPKHTVEVRDINRVAKKSNSETSTKRARNETPSSMPAFKVRKEKMGDRITALQQLVSPFGKTDTASVLSEAIEYIKFLHQQVNVLSSPYMKSGSSMQHHQTGDKSNNPEGAKTQDLRSRGLCLVPVSSTFPVIHETAVDFWNPTFGGTFR